MSSVRPCPTVRPPVRSPARPGDIADDKYFRKANDSDATQWEVLYPRVPAHVWGALWIAFEVAVVAGFVLLGIVAFKRTPDEMYAEAAQFLPT